MDLRPKMSVASDWANHALNLTAGADIGRYATYSRLNYEDWLVSADGRVDITRDSALLPWWRLLARTRRPRRAGFPADAKNPTEYDLINGFGRYVQRVGRFRGIGEATIVRLDYDKTNTVDGPSINNTGRDRNVYAGGLQLGYELVPSYEAFVRAEGNTRQYDQRLDAGERNGTRRATRRGGRRPRSAASPSASYTPATSSSSMRTALDTVSAPTFGGTLTWNATTLTTSTHGSRASSWKQRRLAPPVS